MGVVKHMMDGRWCSTPAAVAWHSTEQRQQTCQSARDSDGGRMYGTTYVFPP